MSETRLILSGDEAIAAGAFAAGVKLGAGYPGTPSTEILEHFSKLGGKAQWAPNEKMALEVASGVSFGGGRTIVTMKHVGLNVAADPLFTLAYTGAKGGLVIVSADDPGMASSQNEQDNRLYAAAAHLPMLEPADSQEAYDLTIKAFELSEQFSIPVLLRVTTRVCHSQGIVDCHKTPEAPAVCHYEKDVKSHCMVPAFAKPAHVKLEQKMKDLAAWNASSGLVQTFGDEKAELGIITSGAAFQHSMEAAPEAKILKLAMTWPLPYEKIAEFAKSCKRVVAVEEGEKFLAEKLRANGIDVEAKKDIFLFGELNVSKVKKLIAGDDTAEEPAKPGRPPALCPGCPHRGTFTVLRDMGCIVAGDIGCYSLGLMPPFSALDTIVCMGASIGTGLGLRHTLPEEEARKVVSVIGDSTFFHSGLTGLVEMAYNRPATGHVVIILDNSTTAMTGLQENPATGRHLDMSTAPKVDLETICRGAGMEFVEVVDTTTEKAKFEEMLKTHLAENRIGVIIARRPCILQVKKLAKAAKA